jgi:ferredoxin
MALVITDECINCTACEEECPNHAISQGDTVYVVDAVKCTECVGYEEAPKCIAVCPVDCIVPDPNHAENLAALRVKYTTLNGGPCPDIGKGFVAN